jgi:hypothetical protein
MNPPLAGPSRSAEVFQNLFWLQIPQLPPLNPISSTAVLDQAPGCHGNLSAHPFSWDCHSLIIGPAQGGYLLGEGAQETPRDVKECAHGPPPMIGADSLPFVFLSVWDSSYILSPKLLDSPTSFLAPIPQATLTVCGALGWGGHAEPEQGVAEC